MENRIHSVKLNNIAMNIIEFKISNEDYSDDNCIICMDEYEPSSEIMKLGCNEHHYFHTSCILQWAKNYSSCPICKTQFIIELHDKQSSEKDNINPNINADANIEGNNNDLFIQRQSFEKE